MSVVAKDMDTPRATQELPRPLDRPGHSLIMSGARQHLARGIAVFFGLLLVLSVMAVARQRINHPPQLNLPSYLPTVRLNLGHHVMLDLVRVPAGHFFMGSPDTEDYRDASEGPRHRVTFRREFYIGQTPVTLGQWLEVLGWDQSYFQDDPRRPVDSIGWSDTQKFCIEATRRTGRKFRLPTEAEWEYACRAGTQGPFAFGASLSSYQANFNGNSPYGDAPVGPDRETILPVRSFPPNAWGLYDMHGNISEWCQDVYHDSYHGAPNNGSAWLKSGDPSKRVYRGGAFNNDGDNCRSAVRFAAGRDDTRTDTIGFRVVVELP